MVMFMRNEDITWDELKEGVSKVGEISTGWKNWKDSSRIMFGQSLDGYLRTKGMSRVAQVSTAQAAMRLVGFPDITATEEWENLHTENARKDFINDVANTLAEQWVVEGNYLAEGNDAMAEEAQRRIVGLVTPLDYATWKEVTNIAYRKVGGHSLYEKMLLDLSNRAAGSLSPMSPYKGEE